MHYSALVLQEGVRHSINLDAMEKSCNAHRLSNTAPNPRKFSLHLFEVHKQNSQQIDSNASNQSCEVPKNFRMQLINKTKMVLYSKKRSMMARMVDNDRKNQSQSQKSQNQLLKMTHNYFFSSDRHNQTLIKFRIAQPETFSKEDAGSLSIHKLNPEGISQLKHQKEMSKNKSISKIVERIRNRNNANLKLTHTQRELSPSQQKRDGLVQRRPISTVMNLRHRGAFNQEKKFKLNFTHNIHRPVVTRKKGETVSRPNTTFGVYRSDSSNSNGQFNLTPW